MFAPPSTPTDHWATAICCRRQRKKRNNTRELNNLVLDIEEELDKDKESCYRILNTVGKLLSVDIYDDNIGINRLEERKREFLDSLNLEIQSSFLNLIKYRVSGPRMDLNTISEVDYNINSY